MLCIQYLKYLLTESKSASGWAQRQREGKGKKESEIESLTGIRRSGEKKKNNRTKPNFGTPDFLAETMRTRFGSQITPVPRFQTRGQASQRTATAILSHQDFCCCCFTVEYIYIYNVNRPSSVVSCLSFSRLKKSGIRATGKQGMCSAVTQIVDDRETCLLFHKQKKTCVTLTNTDTSTRACPPVDERIVTLFIKNAIPGSEILIQHKYLFRGLGHVAQLH